MLFSVIIPTYNRASLLREALDSVFAQTLTDYEVIVVDDGSTDGTDAVAVSYEPRIHFFQQQNGGPGAARNLGAQQARGDYLAFLDSDDLWFPWTLAGHHSVLQQYEGCSMVSGTGVLLGSGPQMQNDDRDKIQAQYYDCFLDALHGPILPVGGSPSIVLRREVFVQLGGFAPDRMNGEDTDLWLRCGNERGFVRLIAPAVFAQRVHPGNVTDDCERSLKGMDYLFGQEFGGHYPGGLRHRRRRIDVIAANARTVSLRCLDHHRLGEAWAVYRRAFGWHLELRRWKFLLAFPALVALKSTVGRRGAKSRH